MKELWISIENVLSGENGPLYVALCAITGLTLGWRFLDKNYQAEWDGVKICPTGSTPIHSNTEIKNNSVPFHEVDDDADIPIESHGR